LIPVWVGDNPDDEPYNDWERSYAIKIGNQPVSITDSASATKYAKALSGSVITLKVNSWNVGILVESRYYSPEIQLAKRGIPYGVLQSQVIEIEEILKEENHELIPKPKEEILPFSF